MNQKVNPFVIIAGAVFFFLMLVGSQVAITINPGERAIIFRKFTTGLDKEKIYQPGFHLIAPWNNIYVYEVKEQKVEESMDILDKNGLSMAIDITVRYNPTYNKIGYLHEEFGRSYVDRLVIPEVRSAVRKVMGRYEAEEIYSTKRNEVEQTIIDETKTILAENNVIMKALLIRSIRLPEKIRQAIDDKLKQEQEASAYRYRLDKEESEAERKRIAASGEAAANKIINSSLTPSLLKMRGIEATIELSKSNNSKVVVIGSGENGMPLILND
jgi:regulator of protease activity HflC (stomatin/prohibitin superfamily)